MKEFKDLSLGEMKTSLSVDLINQSLENCQFIILDQVTKAKSKKDLARRLGVMVQLLAATEPDAQIEIKLGEETK